jgi:hypothetical protein
MTLHGVRRLVAALLAVSRTAYQSGAKAPHSKEEREIQPIYDDAVSTATVESVASIPRSLSVALLSH